MHLPNHSQFRTALQRPSLQPASTPSLFAAWRTAWREAPAEARRDVLCLAAMTPTLAMAFALLWGMSPA